MELKHPYLFEDIQGYTPHISRLIYMMNYARLVTLHYARDLSQEELDTLLFPESNSIGMLLAHIAAIEKAFQDLTLFGINRSPSSPAEVLGEKGREALKGKPLEHYLHDLAEVRKVTLNEFKKRDDDWLNESTPWWNDEPANNYFKWFHVFEDEINHRGQIAIIRKQIKSK